NVYAFAFYIFQQLNRWPDDGAKDYGKAIFRISPYVTPRYRTDLMTDLEQRGRKGEPVYLITPAVECKLKWLFFGCSDIRLKGCFGRESDSAVNEQYL
ncbi:MAG: TIGR03746 family integrating conjugative element protein, partial [Candidatus Thiodiazotropha taylori]|nr:TIGR03746 family integrating conjugative element protein [Candidatus Thiodiazotropha taylori]MCW4335579.1 TIGR03746 family integrating conjugative element protein [Candidatus Thiodiazotropha endolucinida]